MSCTRDLRELADGEGIDVGCTVHVQELHDAEQYTIVPPGQADGERGRISPHSPVGRALLGHRAGEELVVQTPGGSRRLRILEVVGRTACE
jgi:transcription elongation factor GreA